MSVSLVDKSLMVDVIVEAQEDDFDDNIRIRIVEDCPSDEKLFRADIVSIYITPEQAGLLVLELERALGECRNLRSSS